MGLVIGTGISGVLLKVIFRFAIRADFGLIYVYEKQYNETSVHSFHAYLMASGFQRYVLYENEVCACVLHAHIT